MPGGNGTGPRGQGPMTGGGRGNCAVPAGRVVGNMSGGRLLGRGGGRGWRNWYHATGLPGWQRFEVTAEDEKEALRSEAEVLKQQLLDVQNRISTLEGEKEQK